MPVAEMTNGFMVIIVKDKKKWYTKRYTWQKMVNRPILTPKGT